MRILESLFRHASAPEDPLLSKLAGIPRPLSAMGAFVDAPPSSSRLIKPEGRDPALGTLGEYLAEWDRPKLDAGWSQSQVPSLTKESFRSRWAGLGHWYGCMWLRQLVVLFVNNEAATRWFAAKSALL